MFDRRGIVACATGGVPLLLLLSLLDCTAIDPLSTPHIEAGMGRIRAEIVADHMRALADDRLEGRAAGTAGYRLAAEYVEAQFEALGLQPAGVENGYLQPVPLRSSTVDAGGSSLNLTLGSQARSLVPDVDYLMAGDFTREEVGLQAPLVYVGYGVSAPELGYDDYEGVDVRGKAIVVFRGAPAAFPHNERAYFSSSTLKMKNAVERGAVGVVTMRTPEGWKRWSWERAVQHARMPSMRWIGEGGKPHDDFPEMRLGAQLSVDGMEKLFAGATHGLQEIHAAVEDSRPFSFELPWTVESKTASRQESVSSPNLAAVLRGSDSALKDEYVVFTAHLDHVGVGDSIDGDAIHNGAYDNASGIGIMLAIARAFSEMEPAPRRSLLFLAVTAEEKGLLGADYFVHHPTVPLDSLVADVNLDMVLMLHPLIDVIAFGAEHSSLAGPMEMAARHLDVKLSPDPVPEEVLFVRSDQYPFVRKGIPSLFVVSGWESGDPGVDGGALENEWLKTTYHTPRDDMSQKFDFAAGEKFARVNFLVGYMVANETERPGWNPGDFFGEKFGRSRRGAAGRIAAGE